MDGGFFEFQLKVDPTVSNELVVTYWGGEIDNRVFDILIDGQKIATQTLLENKPNAFFDQSYPLPGALTHGKSTVTVRFAAHPAAIAGGVYGVRTMKAAVRD